MLTPEQTQQLLGVVQRSADPYEVARAAGFLMTQPAHAAEAAGYFLRSLKILRLNAAAERFSGTAATAGAGGGLIPWASRARRFAANAAALAQTSPDAAARIQTAAGELKHYELHQTGDGNFEILDLRKALPLGWLGGMANHKVAGDAFQFDRQKTAVPQPLAFDGVSFGWLLLRVVEATENSFLSYSCPIYILEPDAVAVAMLFHMHDLTRLIAGPRLRWFVGESAEAVLGGFRAAAEKQASWTLPGTFVRSLLTERAALDLQGAVAAVQATREAARQACRSRIAAYYADKTQSYWRQRFEEALAGAQQETGRREPLRVLGLTSRFTTVLQYSMAELQAAVRAAGMEMEVAIEPDDQSLENPWLEKIAEFKPDLIVQISRMRYENPGLPANVPFLTWDQDNLVCMRTPQATASLDGLTFVAGQGALHGYAYMNWPARNVILCHLASATHRYQPRALSPAEEKELACDFSYLSNAAAAPQVLCDQHMPRFGGGGWGAAQAFGELCDGILASPLDPQAVPWNEPSVREALLKIATQRGIRLPDETVRELILSALLVADRTFRHQTLQWVSDFCKDAGKTLRIYGSGWETHPTLAPHAAGVARAGGHLQAITQATRINLQIIGTGVLHPRLLDGLAAGGFFMFRRTQNDAGNAKHLAALEQVSRHVFQHGIESFAAMDGITDASLRAAWERVAPEYRRSRQRSGLDERTIFRGIATAHSLRHPTLLLTALNEIAFETPAELAAGATRFLADRPGRAAIAQRLRADVVRNFSYDARWQTFVEHMRRALGP
jgi:hypothetical protein